MLEGQVGNHFGGKYSRIQSINQRSVLSSLLNELELQRDHNVHKPLKQSSFLGTNKLTIHLTVRESGITEQNQTIETTHRS